MWVRRVLVLIILCISFVFRVVVGVSCLFFSRNGIVVFSFKSQVRCMMLLLSGSRFSVILGRLILDFGLLVVI